MANETQVTIQAASDAWMAAQSDVDVLTVDDYGATTTVPLITLANGMCVPDGQLVQIANTLEPTINGNTYNAWKYPGTGGTSYFNGRSFYLRGTDGNAISAVQNRAAGGTVTWFLSDDDPRKMYGLPYTYIKHTGTHIAAWTTGTQPGRSRKYAVANHGRKKGTPYYKGLIDQEFIYRTNWDWVGPVASGEGHSLPGFGFGDKSDSFKSQGTAVTKCEAVSGEAYEAIIHTSNPHFAEVGDLFTTRDFNSNKLANLVVDITGNTPDGSNNVSTIPDVTSVFQVLSVLDGLRFTAHKLANQNSKTNLGLNCTTTGTATTGTSRGAQVKFTGKATHSDDYLALPSRMPTTTRFQLKVTDINHTFNDMVAINPMPKAAWNGKLHEQLQTLGFSLGMRKEQLKLSGTLVDRGLVSATNPRKQVLMNICRTQWLKIMGLWGGKADGTAASGYDYGTSWDHTSFKGKGFAGPSNPRSYPCLTIYDPTNQSSSNPRLVDVNSDSGYNVYRGIIRDLSFTQVGGKPDIWEWSMNFVVMANERAAMGGLSLESSREEE